MKEERIENRESPEAREIQERTETLKKPHGQQLFILWLIPFLLSCVYYTFKLIEVSFKLWENMFVGSLGILLLFIMTSMLIFYLSQFILVRLVLVLIGLAASLVPITAFVATDGKAFLSLFVISLIVDGLGLMILILILKKLLWRVRSEKTTRIFSFSLPKKHQLSRINGAILILICLFGISGGTMGSFLVKPEESHSFTISGERVENYDLVVYFPNYKEIDAQIINIFQEANATLSFPLYDADFGVDDENGEIAAEKVRLLNDNHVAVEIWPLFNYDEGFYPSLSEIDRWDYLYERFHNWTVRNDLVVDYLLWDIEVAGEFQNLPDFENWSQPFRSIGQVANNALKLKQSEMIWEDALDEILGISKKSIQDGHLMRTTTHTIIWDVFDGDADIQKKSALPVWDAANAYSYISMMAYRGCEWGGTPAPPPLVYESVRASSISQDPPIAICLGCINYTPYPSIEDVVDDVYLALAAGANSIRLFQANSWIDGVGEWEGSGGMVYGGIAHGVDNMTTGGLRQLLLECRSPGEVRYSPGGSTRKSALYSIVEDISLDFA